MDQPAVAQAASQAIRQTARQAARQAKRSSHHWQEHRYNRSDNQWYIQGTLGATLAPDAQILQIRPNHRVIQTLKENTAQAY